MDDKRQEELDCVAAIFPEIAFDTEDIFTASIELPVNPQTPVKVVFPFSASSDGAVPSTHPTPPSSVAGQENGESTAGPAKNLELHNLSYLPSLQLRIILPQGYPEEKAPKFELSMSPSWLSREHLDELEASGEQLWEEAGRSLVVYGYIDSLQQAAENAFGLAGEGKILEIPQDYKISLLDYEIKATQAAFEKETFDCGVCLDPKKGTVCHRIIDCGHVFCVKCLQDFYNNAITEGDLASVRCLAPNCAKKRVESWKKKKKLRIQLSPSELLQIPLEHEMVTRYVKLKHKVDLESDKNTVYCPRKWCQGAAKSKKHRKPEGLEDDESGEESENEEIGKAQDFHAREDLLAVCEDCDFAFCSRCFQGWHGEFTTCIPMTTTGELTEEDKASIEYLKLHSTPCPTCAARAQKIHGCNHMICFKCNSHFCYLCSAWLEPGNPYKHYNQERTHCYMRLWELEEGDGAEAEGVAARGEAWLEEEEQEEEQIEVPEVIIREPEIDEPGEVAGPVVPQEALEREGPLVLRINQIPRPPVPTIPDPPPPGRQHHRQGPQNVHRQPGLRHNQQPQRPNGRADIIRGPAGQEAAQQAWVQMFVQMALNDEEDLLDWHSEDEDDAAAWEIPVR